MMRKFLLLAIICLPLFVMSQAQRMVLIEEWTNASCVPCAEQNPDFNTLLDANLDKVVSIKYQWYFPGYDPFQEQNPDECNNRGDHYGLDGVPTAWIDGQLPTNSYGDGSGNWGGYAGGPYGYTQGIIDWSYDQTTPISMSLEHSFNDNITEITVNVTITNMGTEDFTMADGRLQIVLMEETVEFVEAPGSTDERIFYNVMRKMYPDENGTAVTTIAAGTSMDFTITGAVPDYIYNLAELKVAAFVEDYSSSEVWQAAITEPQPIANAIDAAVGSNLTIAPTSLCGGMITPIVEISNPGAVEVTHAEVKAVINGTVIETMIYEGNLMTSETATITFSEVTLTEANSTLTFELGAVNNGSGVDINSNNDASAPITYSSLSETPIGTSLEEDNESYFGTYPATAVALPAISEGDFGGNTFLVFSREELTADAGDPVGGFGDSDRSILINYYQWNPASTPDQGSLIYQKIDLSGATSPSLQFDRASASYVGDGVSTDRLQIRVSTDCGETWDIVWDEEGAGLNTRSSVDPFYVPGGNDWETATIDLSAYIGQEVNVEFMPISGWGNNLYLDNINITELVGIQELTEVSEIRLFPNPVKEMMKVSFQLEAANQLQIEVFNAVGQRVQNLGTSSFNTGNNQFDINARDLSNGVYFLRIYNADKELNRRFVVQH